MVVLPLESSPIRRFASNCSEISEQFGRKVKDR